MKTFALTILLAAAEPGDRCTQELEATKKKLAKLQASYEEYRKAMDAKLQTAAVPAKAADKEDALNAPPQLDAPAQGVEAGADAPLGLRWGVSLDEARKAGIDVDEMKKTERNVVIVQVKKTPKTIHNQAFAVLMFYPTKGLQKIVWVSRDIDQDSRGTAGKEAYNSLKRLLVKKYGDPQSYEYSGRKLYGDADEFYQCLRYDGCGGWTSFYEPKGSAVRVQLELMGTGRGEGFLRITFEGPSFSETVHELKKQTQKNDEDAL